MRGRGSIVGNAAAGRLLGGGGSASRLCTDARILGLVGTSGNYFELLSPRPISRRNGPVWQGSS